MAQREGVDKDDEKFEGLLDLLAKLLFEEWQQDTRLSEAVVMDKEVEKYE